MQVEGVQPGKWADGKGGKGTAFTLAEELLEPREGHELASLADDCLKYVAKGRGDDRFCTDERGMLAKSAENGAGVSLSHLKAWLLAAKIDSRYFIVAESDAFTTQASPKTGKMALYSEDFESVVAAAVFQSAAPDWAVIRLDHGVEGVEDYEGGTELADNFEDEQRAPWKGGGYSVWPWVAANCQEDSLVPSEHIFRSCLGAKLVLYSRKFLRALPQMIKKNGFSGSVDGWLAQMCARGDLRGKCFTVAPNDWKERPWYTETSGKNCYIETTQTVHAFGPQTHNGVDRSTAACESHCDGLSEKVKNGTGSYTCNGFVSMDHLAETNDAGVTVEPFLACLFYQYKSGLDPNSCPTSPFGFTTHIRAAVPLDPPPPPPPPEKAASLDPPPAPTSPPAQEIKLAPPVAPATSDAPQVPQANMSTGTP